MPNFHNQTYTFKKRIKMFFYIYILVSNKLRKLHDDVYYLIFFYPIHLCLALTRNLKALLANYCSIVQ